MCGATRSDEDAAAAGVTARLWCDVALDGGSMRPSSRMRLVVTLSHSPQGEHPCAPSSVAFELKCDRAARQELDCGGKGPVVSIFSGGPHDERVRRDIAEGEHIIEDPGFDLIGFYGLAGIERGGAPVVQWYRWIDNTAESAEGATVLRLYDVGE